ncbi:primosomal replication protein PriC [Candidatus Colwellia aromaticivorans]|uniref:primosomal replication protein PriC n=1 Tax=Candidatus Colwellia aromaticivorans TaxID=2267621 RepID=UPI001FE4367C|nr:primosomal replication protein PriC [Candidatus Colwellia aromaticivorans]
MNSIERLTEVLMRLAIEAKQIDTLNTQNKSHRLIENNNLFSPSLFFSQSDRYLPYVEEIERRLAEFTRLVASNKIELSIVLLEHLEQQIAAISNALNANSTIHQAAKLSFDANKKVRIKKAKAKQVNKYRDMANNLVLNSHQLYQKLTEHHEFERRLMDMLLEKERQRVECKKHESEKLSIEVLTLHQRLGRCRKAITTIERDIELAEKR